MKLLYYPYYFAIAISVTFLLVGYTPPAAAQVTNHLMIKGRVTAAESGEPLAGASVRIRNTTTGTKSGIDGMFFIRADGAADTLIASYVGYASRQVVVSSGSGEVNIVLDRTGNELKEVLVSTGYQTLPQERATGSFTTVDRTLLNRRVSPDLLSRLEDLTSGLSFDRRFGGEPSLSVRGRSTILANDQPLIVVDNFPYEGDINHINPNDVERVTVLKDAAAASIWGSRAGNGVIVITTKKGRLNQPLKVELNANISIGQKPDLFYNRGFLNSADFIEVEKKLFAQGFYDTDLSDPTYPVVSPVVNILNAARNGTISAETANQQINNFKTQDVRRDFDHYFYRKSIAQQYALSISGGGNNATYHFSGGYDHDLDNAVGNQGNRITLNAANTFRLLKKLEISTNLVYTGTSRTDNNVGYNAINSGGPYGKSLYPYARLAGEAGTPLSIAKNYNSDYLNTTRQTGYLDWNYKPLRELQLADNTDRQNDIRLNSAIRYELNSWLNAVVTYQFQRSAGTQRYHYSDSTYYARDLINLYTQDDGSGSLTHPIPLGGILDQSQTEQATHSGRLQLNMDHNFAIDHRVSAIAGIELRQSRVTSDTYRLFGYNDDILTSVPVNEVDYFYLSPVAYDNQIPTNYALTDRTDRYRSYFANASYTYKGRYILSGSARKDESNLFGVRANQKGVPLWSAGLAWIASEEPFYHLSGLPYLKLRASYGYNGNVVKSVTAFTVAGYHTDNLTGLPYAVIQSPPNPDLRWEKIGIVNLGLDFETGNHRVSGTLEYYHKSGTDLIGDAPLDPTTGFFTANKYSYRGNNANVAGHGFDVTLKTANLQGKFSWQTNYLFSYANIVVTHYAYDQPPGNYFLLTPPPLEGRPQYSIYSYKFAGLNPANGNPMVYHKGVATDDYAGFLSGLTTDDLVYNGPALPPYFGALRNTFSFKNFEASFNISYKFGYYFRRSSIGYSALYNSWQGHQDFSQRWQQPGDEKRTNVPSMPENADQSRDNVYLNADALVDKGDHIRLQDISLSYTLTRDKVRKLPFTQVSFYAYANNLGILWRANHDHLDPDYSSLTFPPSKTISLGVRANF